MHGDIGAVFEQGLFQLFDKQPFTADFCQRRIQNPVALTGHGYQRYRNTRVMVFQLTFDILCLPQGEGAFARGDTNDFHKLDGFCRKSVIEIMHLPVTGRLTRR